MSALQPLSTRAIELTRRTLHLAFVPLVATLLSFSKVVAMATPHGGGGVTFPLPTGLPTLWTFVNTPGLGRGTVGPATSAATVVWVPLFVLGFLLVSALQGGFLGVLANRAEGRRGSFVRNAGDFLPRMVGANLITMLVVFVALPLLFFPPLAIVVALVLSYLVYGLPFVVVVEDMAVLDALGETIRLATTGGRYLEYAVGYLVVGTVASFVLTAIVYNLGLLGVLLGAVVVAVPALFLAAVGVLVFRDLAWTPGRTPV